MWYRRQRSNRDARRRSGPCFAKMSSGDVHRRPPARLLVQRLVAGLLDQRLEAYGGLAVAPTLSLGDRFPVVIKSKKTTGAGFGVRAVFVVPRIATGAIGP